MIPEMISRVAAFPLAQVGGWLRWLSLSGGVGNVIAWVLYVGFCTAPLWGWVASMRRRSGSGVPLRWRDLFPVALSVLLFPVMYLMANPGAMPGNLRLFPPHVGRMVAGAAVWSLVLAWGISAFVGRVFRVGEETLGRYLGILLYVLMGTFALAAVVRLWQVPGAFGALQAANVGQTGLGLTYFFIFMRGLVDALPHMMNIWVAYVGLGIVKGMGNGAFSAGMVTVAEQLPKVCATALTATFVSGAAFNVAQFVFAARLADMHMGFNLPVVSVLFMLGALLFARYAARAHEIREENEGFV